MKNLGTITSTEKEELDSTIDKINTNHQTHQEHHKYKAEDNNGTGMTRAWKP